VTLRHYVLQDFRRDKKRKGTVNYFLLFRVDSHKPINGSFASKLLLIGEKRNVAIQAGVCIKPKAEFQLPIHVPIFRMLNSLDIVQIKSFTM